MADAAATLADPRWPRIVARDKAAQGLFWFSVTTTGVYCRPGCPARTPRAANVTIHDTLDAARASGARPCRRCYPDDAAVASADIAAVTRLASVLRDAEEPLSLAAMAAVAGIAPGRLRRLFAAHVGLSPHRYAEACRAERARNALAAGEPVTAALHASGYGSSSRFYAGARKSLGMAPTAARDGGTGERLRYAFRSGPLGLMLVARSAAGVAAILLGDQAEALLGDLAGRFPHARLEDAQGELALELDAVLALVTEPAGAALLPLDIRGTAFQKRVWDALLAIPPGETRTYAQVAAAIGAPEAVRAVAGACAANPLAIAVPCHRVVRSDGGLAGYRWGTDRKRALLGREAGTRDDLLRNV